MADLIALPYRASDATFALVSDATAYFYEAGTSTPLTVYTDSGLGTPRGTSLAADSEGVFSQCWVASGTGVKVDVQDGAGTSLPGFPRDNYPTFPASGTGASSVTFSPVTGNSATDAQTAIANEVARNNATDNAEAIATSGGSGGTFTLTSTYTISAYAAGQVYEFVANQASVGSGSDTLNVDSVGAVVIKKYSGSTSKTDLAAGDISTGDVVRVKHDGTHFVMVSPKYANSTAPGVVTLIDDDTMATATASNVASAESTKAYVDAAAYTQTSVIDLTNSGANDQTTVNLATSLSNVSEIIVDFDQLSLTGTNSCIIQLSTSATFATSGYKSGGGFGGTGAAGSSTSGFIINIGVAASEMSGTMTIRKKPSANDWVASFSAGSAVNSQWSMGGGRVSLGGALDGVRITTSGSDTFDGSSAAWVSYK